MYEEEDACPVTMWFASSPWHMHTHQEEEEEEEKEEEEEEEVVHLLDPSASFKCTTMEACHRYHLWSVPSRKAKPFQVTGFAYASSAQRGRGRAVTSSDHIVRNVASLAWVGSTPPPLSGGEA